MSFKLYADFDWFLKMRKRKDIKITIFPSDKVISNFMVGGVSINGDFSLPLKRGKEKSRAYKEMAVIRCIVSNRLDGSL